MFRNRLIRRSGARAFVFLILFSAAFEGYPDSATKELKAHNVKAVNKFIASIPEDVAVLSGKKLHKSILLQELMPLLKRFKDTPTKLNEEDLQKLKEAAVNSLNQIIDREILTALAEKDGVKVEQIEIDEQFAKIAKYVEGGASALVQQIGVAQSSLKQKVAQGLLIEKWLQEKFIPQFAPGEREVEEFYRNSQDMFLVPEKVAISHIFLSSDNFDDEKAAARLESLRKTAKTSEGFRKIAKETSDDERTKENGGSLGEYSIQELPKPFADAIAKVPAGEISAPFKSLLGWHIVRVDSRTVARYIPYQEAYPVIKKYLTEKRADSKLKELLENEKKQRECKVYFK